MPKLSIIVPIYKVEAYLPKCIDSILAQTFTDWELLLIDDGSPDACPAICDHYAALDDRIHVIHQANAGVSAARNRGLEAAQASLIAFIDPDDHLTTDCYESMLSAMKRTGTGMAICGFLYEYPDGTTEPRVADGKEVLLSHHDLVDSQFDIPWTIRTGTCNKIFQKEVIGNLRFDCSLKCCEDTLFLSQYLLRYNGSAIHICKPLYINHQREGSAMHGGLSMASIEASLAVHRTIVVNTTAVFPDLFDRAIAYYLDSCAWKLNAYKDTLCPKGKKAIQQHNKICHSIRRRVLREWRSILASSQMSLGLKFYYFLLALNLK